MLKISIIMAVYNENLLYLKDSVNSILKQTLTDFEFVIVDDGSNSITRKALLGYAKQDSRIKLIINAKNIGLTKSLNIAIKKSKGAFIARMDSDDISLPNRLTLQLEYLIQEKLDLTGSNCDIINNIGNIIKKRREPIPSNYKKEIFKQSLFAHSTFFGKKQVFKELYNENFKIAQDYEFLLRILGKNYKIGHILGATLLYRLNDHGISIKKVKKQDISALRARVLSILIYNYPFYYIVYLVKPLLLFMTPLFIQHFILYGSKK